MLQSILVMAAISLYFIVQAMVMIRWLPEAFRKLKARDASFEIPFGPAVLWALFSFFVLLSYRDALIDQPCWITCGMNPELVVVLRFIGLYGVINAIPILLIWIAWQQHQVKKIK